MGRGPRVRRAEDASVLGEVGNTLRKHPVAEDGRGEDTETIDKHRLGAGRLALGAGRVIPHPDLGNICAGPTCRASSSPCIIYYPFFKADTLSPFVGKEVASERFSEHTKIQERKNNSKTRKLALQRCS